ncbi:MAG: MMPL family transporter [Pirellulales bacterium]|nr:MMPL family transporter [Pirellulales bacterium]
MPVLLRYSWTTLGVAVGLGLLATIYTVLALGYKSGRTDLIDPHSDYQRLWTEFVHEFGEQDDAVIVVEGHSREELIPVLREVSEELNRDHRLFRSVLHEVDLSKIRSKGLYYLEPEELTQLQQSLPESTAIVQGEWTRLQVSKTLGGLVWRCQTLAGGDAPPAIAAQANLRHYLNCLIRVFEGSSAEYPSPWPDLPAAVTTLSQTHAEYLLSPNGRLGFVLLRLDPGNNKLAPYSEATDELRGLLARIRLKFPGVGLGLTGLPVMENDEMRASQDSMLWGSVISLAGVLVIIIAGFGGVRHALLANLVLLLGMAWSFGFATLAVGHLNILSVTFTATLIGVGIDYGTYYVARYLQYRAQGEDPTQAILNTSTAVGPGIFTGAVTTAIAFFSAACTSFTGVAELGIIAGGGLILCAIAQLYILPVCLYLVDRSRWGASLPVALPVHRLFFPLWNLPRMTMFAGLLATAALAWGLPRLWYDYNLLNLQPQGLESVAWEQKLLQQSEQSVWYAISIAPTREELLRRKAEFVKLASVERTQEIVSLLPQRDPGYTQQIESVSQSLANLPERPPLIAVDLLERLGAQLATLQAQWERQPDSAGLAQQCAQLRDLLRRLPPAECYARLSAFQQNSAGELLSRLHLLKSVANPAPPRLSDLPDSLVDRFVGQNGQYLLKIYGRGNIWNMAALQKFVADVRKIDPRATGNPLQAYEASRDMKRSFEQAAIYALVVIAVVLWLDFQNVWHCCLAALPLILGMLQTFGMLAWINQPLNPANMIALPLIMGIGIDYGVHIVHNYLEQPGRYHMTPATALAIMVDALTTIIGFGSLMLASHQGLHSLGRVLTLGITFCTLTSMVLLPILLRWLSTTRHKNAAPTMEREIHNPLITNSSHLDPMPEANSLPLELLALGRIVQQPPVAPAELRVSWLQNQEAKPVIPPHETTSSPSIAQATQEEFKQVSGELPLENIAPDSVNQQRAA